LPRLQRLDRVIGDDVLGIQGHDFLDILGDDRLTVGVDQGLDSSCGAWWFSVVFIVAFVVWRSIQSTSSKNNP
jgi:hypothetical protein